MNEAHINATLAALTVQRNEALNACAMKTADLEMANQTIAMLTAQLTEANATIKALSEAKPAKAKK